MKKVKRLIVYCMLALIPCGAFADQARDMMGEYMKMGDGTAQNFPKALEGLMPKIFTIKSKTFVYRETQNMFLCLGLGGTKKDGRPFGTDTEVNIGIMGYNPRTASYMAATWSSLAQNQKQYGKMDGQKNYDTWVFGPVTTLKVNQADVFIQKGTHRNIELDDGTRVEYEYYFAETTFFAGNMMIAIRINFFADKIENMKAAIKSTLDFFQAAKWDAYMK